MRYPNWVTKTGEKIPINKMSDSHLCNALRYLKRYAQHTQTEITMAVGAAACSFSGEMATYYAEQEFDRVLESDWTEFVPPIFTKMDELATKRKLK